KRKRIPGRGRFAPFRPLPPLTDSPSPSEVRRMARDFIDLMRILFLPAARREAPWRPPADVYRTRRGWLVKLDLAGVLPEDLTVTLEDRRLTWRGRRRDLAVAEGHVCQRLEIVYSHFERHIELPCDPGRTVPATDYRDGMLLITIGTEEAPL